MNSYLSFIQQTARVSIMAKNNVGNFTPFWTVLSLCKHICLLPFGIVSQKHWRDCQMMVLLCCCLVSFVHYKPMRSSQYKKYPWYFARAIFYLPGLIFYELKYELMTYSAKLLSHLLYYINVIGYKIILTSF